MAIPWPPPYQASSSLYHDNWSEHSRSLFIRLLDLQPGYPHTRIVCKLRTVRFGSNADWPPYEALSYTWGASVLDRQIMILANGQTLQIPVTDNLYNALRRLRRSFGVRTLWVDAICIDQTDPVDKSRQVARMGQIYENAIGVNVWLGEPSRQTWTIKKVAFEIYVMVMSVFVIPIWLFELYDAWGNDEGLTFLRNVVRFVCLRPQRLEVSLEDTSPCWIDRVWIVQEFLMARKLWICFGSVRMKYDWSALCAMYYSTDLGFEYEMPHFKHLIDRLSPYALMKLSRTERWSDHKKPDLLSAILATRQAEASRPVDKVWGIVGLLGSNERADINMDYTQPIYDAYIQATRASIHQTRTLDILHLAGLGQSKIDQLPTWAADFSQSASKLEFATHEPWMQTPRLPGLPGMPVHNTFMEKRLEPAEPPLHVPKVWQPLARNTGDRLLRLKGIYLSRITEVCVLQKSPKEKVARHALSGIREAGEYRAAYASTAKELASMLEAVKYRLSDLNNLHQPLIDLHDRAPAAAEDETRRGNTDLKISVYLTSWNYMLESEELLRLGERLSGLFAVVAACFRHWAAATCLVLRPSPSVCIREERGAAAARPYAIPADVEHYLDTDGVRACGSQVVDPDALPEEGRHEPFWMDPTTMRAHLNVAEQETDGKAVFFATASGFIGLGRGDLCVGDVVIAVPGARIPLVLRRSEDSVGEDGRAWEFRGFAYTHGMMFGELISMMVDLEAKGELDDLTEEFVLC